MSVERVATVLNPELHLWGWEVAAEQFLATFAAGLLVFVAWVQLSGRREEWLPAVRLATLLAPAAVVVGLFLLWLDLGGKWRPFWLYLTVRPTSAMWWGSWIILAVLLSSSLTAFASVVKTEERTARRALEWLQVVAQWAETRIRVLGWTNLVLGIGLGLYPGILVGTMAARPLWNSPVLGLLFLVSGMATATAALLLLVAGGPWVPVLAGAQLGLQGGRAVLMGLYLVGLATGGAAAQAAAGLLLRGPWAPAFWGMVVGGGIVVPAAVAARGLRPRQGARGWEATAWVLALAGDLTLRVLLVYAGQKGL